MDLLSLLANIIQIATFVQAFGSASNFQQASDLIAYAAPRMSADQLKIVEEKRRLLEILIVDSELLDDITQNIDDAILDYRRGLRSGNPSERDAADRTASRKICEWLNRLRDLNGGELPDGDWPRWWKSYRCVRFS